MFNVQVKRKLNTQIIHFEVDINIFVLRPKATFSPFFDIYVALYTGDNSK